MLYGIKLNYLLGTLAAGTTLYFTYIYMYPDSNLAIDSDKDISDNTGNGGNSSSE